MSRTLLAVPIVATPPAIAEQAQAARLGGADLIELRVDSIADVQAVEDYLLGPQPLPCILTIRAADEGGAWDADENERISLYERLGLLSPGYVDVELRSWERSANLRQKLSLVCWRLAGGEPPHAHSRARNELILSVHDFRSADGMTGLLQELASSPANVVKLAVTPEDATQALQLLELMREHAQRRRLIAIGMGEPGLCTRVLAGRFGAAITFAALDHQHSSAPGQIPLTQLRQVYRWDAITPATKLFGVIGWPVTHSRSPALHNAAMSAAGIDGVYLPLPVRPNPDAFHAFVSQVNRCPEQGWSGFSVTLPHKEHAWKWLKDHGGSSTDLAQRCRAVNTLIKSPSGWHGANTDAAGALQALQAHGFRPDRAAGIRVGVLGAGGAARSIVPTLCDLGCRVTIYNRTQSRAEALAGEFGAAAAPWERRSASTEQIWINCTPLGLSPAIDDTPLATSGFSSGQIVLDTVYNPSETRLLREAAAAGCICVSGVEMFAAQAAEQFRLWHGREADPTVMRAALDQPHH